MDCTCCGVSDSPDGLQGHPVGQHQFLVHRSVGVQNNDLGYRQDIRGTLLIVSYR